MKKPNNDCWVSYEIRVCNISNDYKSRPYKSTHRMVINDVEYNHIKKSLDNEYGIGDHFEDLDKEVEKIKSSRLINRRVFKCK